MADYSDDFNRATIGANWTTVSAATTWAITGNVRAYSYGDNYNAMVWSANSLTQDHYSEAVMGTCIISYNSGGVCCRASNAADTWYGFFVNTGGCFLHKMVAGSGADLATNAAVGANGSVVRIEVTGAGDITCKIDGSTVITYTDSSSPLSGTYCGVTSRGSNSDNISLDSWAGGDLGGGATAKAYNYYAQL